jgi:hypothetical protein
MSKQPQFQSRKYDHLVWEINGVRAEPNTLPPGQVTDWDVWVGAQSLGWRHVATLPHRVFAGHEAQIMDNVREGRPFGYQPMDTEAAERELVEGADVTCCVDGSVREAVAEEYAAGGVFRPAVDQSGHRLWPDLSRETFARLFGEPPPFVSSSLERKMVVQWADKLSSAANWETARDLAVGDQWLAGMCSGALLSWLQTECLTDDAPDPGVQERKLEMAKEIFGAESPEVEAVSAGLELVSSDLEKWERSLAKVQAPPSKVLGDVLTEASGIREAMGVLAYGTQTGLHSVTTEPPSVTREMLRKNPRFRELVRLAGRMRSAAQESRRTKTNYVPEEIVDVTLGGEIGRLLPTELMTFGADTEDHALRRLSERQCLEYELRGREKQQQGPILVAVDASGSMDGARRDWAAAVALTLLESCAREGRPMAWCWFDTEIKLSKLWDNPRLVRASDLMEMACFSANGGTSLRAPLEWGARSLVGKWKQADMVLVSDGGAIWPADSAKKLRDLGCRIFGVSIDSAWPAEATKDTDGGVLTISQQQISSGETKLDLLWRI